MTRMKQEPDELDMQIIKLLRKNARLSLRKMAEKLNVATGTVQSRVMRLEKDGIIRRYCAQIDSLKLGYNVSALIGARVKKTDMAGFMKKITAHRNVIGAYDVAGEFDAFVVVRFKSINELDEFIKAELGPPTVESTNSFIVLGTYKEGQTLFD